jgi:hypothetical protein
VIDGPQSVVWDEAENRMHVQKALMEYLLLGKVASRRRPPGWVGARASHRLPAPSPLRGRAPGAHRTARLPPAPRLAQPDQPLLHREAVRPEFLRDLLERDAASKRDLQRRVFLRRPALAGIGRRRCRGFASPPRRAAGASSARDTACSARITGGAL